MAANSDDIYIKADRNIEVAKKSVTAWRCIED